MDLQEDNSLVKFLTAQNIEVYIISWRNPQPGLASLSFDDYVEKGALKAIEVVCSFSKTKKTNALGYCLGGTLLSIASSIISLNKKECSINTATFLGTMIDFSDIGPMGDVIDIALVKKLEREELNHQGILHGHDMERAFNLIRAKDLIWRYVIDNYLKGTSPAPFDIMYWTNDNANLPSKMYIYYMRNMILSNKLSRKNALRICNTKIDIGRIEFPVFVVGMQDDYISPAKTCFITTELVSGPVKFILAGSGHVIGAINPPWKNKYGYYLDGETGYGFEEWQKTAKFHEGSWWSPWSKKLKENSGKEIRVKEKNEAAFENIEPAPGRYVLEKCIV